MKRITIIIILHFISLMCFAQNAFTIHKRIHSPVMMYYDTSLKRSHVILKIYPHSEFLTLNKKEVREWTHKDHFPLCGTFVSIISEADNDTFFVSIEGDLSGYVKRGQFAVTTRNYDNMPLYLYEEPNYVSKRKMISNKEHYATIFGKKGDWFYVTVFVSNRHRYSGWLPPEMQCHSFLTTCP